MKKALTAFATAGTLALYSLPALAGWEDWLRGGGDSPAGSLPTDENAVFDVLNTVVNWLFAFLLLGAVIVVIIAAYNFLTSAGDAEKTKKARDYITYALIAVIVGFLAKAAVVMVGVMLGVDAGKVIN